MASDLSGQDEKAGGETGAVGAAAGSDGAQQQQQQPAAPGGGGSSSVLAEEERAAESLAAARAMAAVTSGAEAAELRCERQGSSGRALLQWECRRLSVTGDVAEDPEVAQIVKVRNRCKGSSLVATCVTAPSMRKPISATAGSFLTVGVRTQENLQVLLAGI